MHAPLDRDADELLAGKDIFDFSGHCDWREVRRYQSTGDGHEAIVSVVRLPARFWRIECPDLDLDLVTGSGSDMARLADSIAGAIAEGTLGVKDEMGWS